MRILMVTDFYAPFLGGVEQHVRTLSGELASRGHDVAVATLGSPGLPASELDGRVRVHRVPSTTRRFRRVYSKGGRAWTPPFPDPEAVQALYDLIRHRQPDIVHAHDWLGRSFLPLKAWSRASLVVSLHYYTMSCAKKSLMYRDAVCSGPAFAKCLGCAAAHYGPAKGTSVVLGNWLAGAAERAAVDMFLPVSRAVASGNGLIGSGLPFRVIPNFLPDDVDRPRTTVGAYVAQLPPDGFSLFVGDLRRFKGIEVLLSAYAAIADPPPLVLLGKVWPETPRYLPPNVTLLQNWPNHAVMEAWRRSTLAVVPSIGPEPFGLVVLEAMAMGRPVIASGIGGIPDVVADEDTGLLVPPGNPIALRQAIERLLADPDLRERMGRSGQQRAHDFRASKIVPQIENVYASLRG